MSAPGLVAFPEDWATVEPFQDGRTLYLKSERVHVAIVPRGPVDGRPGWVVEIETLWGSTPFRERSYDLTVRGSFDDREPDRAIEWARALGLTLDTLTGKKT